MDYYCFVSFFQSRPGIAVPLCILQCASGEGAQCSDEATSSAAACRVAHNARIQTTF